MTKLSTDIQAARVAGVLLEHRSAHGVARTPAGHATAQREAAIRWFIGEK